MLELIPWDGNVFVWVAGGVVMLTASAAGVSGKMWLDIQDLKRNLYGSEKDDTDSGLIEHSETTRETMNERFDGLEDHVDEKFDRLEERMIRRHDELAVTMAKIIQQMDDPPEDVDIYGPFQRPDRYRSLDSDDRHDDSDTYRADD